MKIFLTGVDGYIGSVLAPLLLQEGHEVIGLDTGYYVRDACTAIHRSEFAHRR